MKKPSTMAAGLMIAATSTLIATPVVQAQEPASVAPVSVSQDPNQFAKLKVRFTGLPSGAKPIGTLQGAGTRPKVTRQSSTIKGLIPGRDWLRLEPATITVSSGEVKRGAVAYPDARSVRVRVTALAAGAEPEPIPDDFPLALRIAENESDGERPVPSRDGPGVEQVKACGQQLWPIPARRVVDRLRVQATGPEHVDGRELVSMTSVRAARRSLTEIRRTLRGCTEPRHTVVWTIHESYLSNDSVTFSRTYTRGLGAHLFHVIRVRSGISILHSYEASLEGISPILRRQVRLGRDLAYKVCKFYLFGCFVPVPAPE